MAGGAQNGTVQEDHDHLGALEDTVLSPRRHREGDEQGAAEPDVWDTIIFRPPTQAAVSPSVLSALIEPPVLSALIEPPVRTAYGQRKEGDAPAEPSPAQTFSRFRIAGTIVLLDATARVGRKPTRQRVGDGGRQRLVQVPSPSQQVSATHLEIRQRGASVVVTDLRSTNGTVVNIPGRVPRTLRQGESMVVSPGTLVDIGDGNLIEILPMHSLQGNQT